MSLIKIKDRYVFLTPQKQKGLWKALMQDYTTEDGVIPKKLNDKTAREFTRRTTIFLAHINRNANDIFDEDWIHLSLDDQEAKFQITNLLLAWCSLRKGFKVTSDLTPLEKIILKNTGIDMIYPLGSTIQLVADITPTYVKLLGWSPSFRVTINCDTVEEIKGEIDTKLTIDLPAYTINLTNKIEVIPRLGKPKEVERN